VFEIVVVVEVAEPSLHIVVPHLSLHDPEL